MIFRRHKGLWQAFFLLLFAGVTLRFSYNYYKENENKLKAANIRHHELLEERNKLSRDLDGVMESKNNLEYTLRTKTQQFKKLKEEWDVEKRNLENQANKDKANVDALDSEYRMLKSKHDDLQIDYEHMKKNFDRLKQDHTKLDTEHQNNYQELKKKEEKVISALQKQLEHYQKQENSLQIKVQELEESVVRYQTVVAKLQSQMRESAKKQVSQVEHDQKAPKAGLQSLKSRRTRRKIVAKESNPKLEYVEKDKQDLAKKSDKNLKRNQFLQDLGKLTVESQQTTDEKNEANVNDKVQDNVGVKLPPKAGKHTVDVIQKNDEGRKDAADQTDENKNEIVDKIEVISENGKEEKNFKLDEQQDIEAKERQALAKDNNAQDKLVREKREAAERLNNDQKFDDQEVALQEEGENEDNVADENEENGMLDKPENLLMNGDEKSQQEEQEGNEQVI